MKTKPFERTKKGRRLKKIHELHAHKVEKRRVAAKRIWRLIGADYVRMNPYKPHPFVEFLPG